MFGLMRKRESDLTLLPQATLVHVLLAYVSLVLPHVGRLPLSCLIFVGFVIVWRSMIVFGKASFPNGFIKLFLVIVLVAILISSFSWRFTVNSAVAFFALIICLKLLEIKKNGDLYSYTFLMVYLAGTEFLFSQQLLMVVYILVMVGYLLFILMSLHTSKNQSNKKALFSIFKLIALSVPFVLIIFLFFPRMSPLWSVPLNSGAARTGMTDTMSPGDIASLAKSDARAFRVEFSGAQPPKRELYWKGLALDRFDGKTWTSSEVMRNRAIGRVSESFLKKNVSDGAYQITVEPTDKRWGFSLDNPLAASSNIFVSDEGFVRLRQPLMSPTLYQVDHLKEDKQNAPRVLNIEDRHRFLQLPRINSPLTTEWIQQQLSIAEDRYDVIDRFLEKINKEDYHYSLQPPVIREDFIDGFIFGTRTGFCSHFASATAYIARRLGIPSRIVAGYQGGEYIDEGGYYVVHQYDAHAWVEIWVEGAGWRRVDPTASVAAERIENGIQAAAREEGSFLSDSLFSAARYNDFGVVRWFRHKIDMANYNWQKHVVGYSGSTQSSLMRDWFNTNSIQFMASMMISGSTILFVIIYLYNNVGWQEVFKRRSFYEKFCKKGEQSGVSRKLGEGPNDYALRLIARYPNQTKDIEQITQAFIALTFKGNYPSDKTMLLNRAMIKKVNALKLSSP